ncbi:hypothetical protein [Sphingobium cupriresistens]|uniref:Uncharacterized protein n=1 Tax=Sphingobium cupriresistens TaxID=1132417 RepID=A0A8G2DYR2_9SPHN|nr:hypothetical protein [Sphingobium cupriresistens]MAM11835.1 hypothetical protein [Rhizobiaceae bacterium]RYM09226.1 hypothetical protein EWH12_14790 [Sphingobium cupriresistens]|tara:strand:- start:3554 stop:4159 length:606 start_codon:yes stop_codon:yes gene_type:complete
MLAVERVTDDGAMMSQTRLRLVEPARDVSILALEAWHVISSRTRNCLGQLNRPTEPASTVAGVRIENMQLSDLSHCERVDLFRLPNLGRVCYCEIAAVMDCYGWRFHDRWTGEPQPPALELLGSSLPRYLRMIRQSAATRAERFKLGETMLKLCHEDGMSGAEIGKRFGVTAAAVNAAIQKTRRVRDLRARLPLPSCAQAS